MTGSSKFTFALHALEALSTIVIISAVHRGYLNVPANDGDPRLGKEQN